MIKNCRIVSDGRILDGHAVLVRDGSVLAVRPEGDMAAPDARVIDLHGAYLAPGFIDMHCHGGDGFEFIDGTDESVLGACRVHAGQGTRVLYPTISATDFDTMWRALLAIERVRNDCPLEIPGVHLEGPYLSTEMSGAQDVQFITSPVRADYTRLIERFGSLIARWTYAPERDDGTFAGELVRNGIVPSIGHSAAEYEHVEAAYNGGCHLVTHFYSCTSTITRRGGFRHLGIIESAYLLDGMYVEAIGDGCHLPPELMRLIVKLKGDGRVCLITDAIRYAGMADCDLTQGGTASIPYVIEDGVAKLADRSAFAGSIATSQTLLERTVAAGIPLASVVKMLTQTPAEVMRLHRKGRIAAGYDAQFTAFDSALRCRPVKLDD